ncbi:DUF1684 domain-containing protein [Egibacter rhizosphaerae]|uniref:DUF1684 domain-containing protein n=1 Tax=Egibacter rhizosphaerae TaxID=1670831 RepID=A0A411YAV4_9ACTN|nr:DUF1684 domain-containing protein [Egibacter rhizosphaerae]QBI18308.1 DUF1684 domain-containing protein [Egibacter rhizosphaerae]
MIDPWPTQPGALALADWRRRVHGLYADVRARWPRDPATAHQEWRERRAELFATHPESPLPTAPFDPTAGPPVPYFAYDPSFAFTAPVETDVDHERFELPISTGPPLLFERIGRVALPVGSLEVYWLHAYGGGLFVPFRDATNGDTTYGGGRYLLDTCKGADLGTTPDGELVLDLNFAYHPSCCYDAEWSCPLAPPSNWLDVAVPVGECLAQSVNASPTSRRW